LSATNDQSFGPRRLGALDPSVPAKTLLKALPAGTLVSGWYPTNQGFDEWWGFPHSSGESLNTIQPGWSADISPIQKILQGRRDEPSVAVGVYDYPMRPLMDEHITQRAVAYIRAHAHDDKPFFLYVPFSLPHAPPLPNPKYRNPAKTDYQNVLHEIDENAGAVLDAIKQAGIENDTLVVWTSNNGPQTHQGVGLQYGAGSDSGPFRGEFPSGWEGALRVPFMMRWPGHVTPGRVSNEIVSILDMYRTFAAVAGASDRVPTDRPIDSIDQSDFFFGGKEKSNREFVIFFHGDDLLSLKWRNFRVHFSVRRTSTDEVRMPGQQELTSEVVKPTYPWVFDIENDPKELWDIGPSSNWLGTPVSKILAQYATSVRDHPNIKPGAAGPSENDPAPPPKPAVEQSD
jgi:arylsulfatase A-like enzyme